MTARSAAAAGVVRRAALLAALGTGAATVFASRLQAAVPLSPLYPARVGLVAGGVMLLALAGVRRHHPLARLGPANLVTGLRALLVALIAAVALEPGAVPVGWWVVVTATVAATLDAADGLLARKTALASAFGARFDMEIDALLVLVLSVLVWRDAAAGPWVMLAGLLRYLFVGAALLLPWLARPLPLSRRRQVVCVVQIAALIVALVPGVTPPASTTLAATSLVLLVWSFWVDVAWLAARRG